VFSKLNVLDVTTMLSPVITFHLLALYSLFLRGERSVHFFCPTLQHDKLAENR